jgi:hypothetical protein
LFLSHAGARIDAEFRRDPQGVQLKGEQADGRISRGTINCAEDKSENTAGRLRGRSTRLSKSNALDERNVGIVRSPIRAIVLLELSKIFSLIHSPTLLLI